QTASQPLSLTINPATLSITTASPLPTGTAGAAYSQPLTATGGTSSYSWSVISGTLPAGLTLSSGVISGTPTTAAIVSFTVQVTDSGTQTVAIPVSLTISSPQLSIITASLVAGIAGVTYSQTLTASGGTPPYTWSVTSGTLPTGLTLSSGGVI